MNLLDHLEDWSSQALERAASVVAAKVGYAIIEIFAVRAKCNVEEYLTG